MAVTGAIIAHIQAMDRRTKGVISESGPASLLELDVSRAREDREDAVLAYENHIASHRVQARAAASSAASE
ncbi:MAG TPA: hypothetical protein VKB79_00015 [Bryobacteraceae bacterium]|nr:hypothetical protein [Bryobacteraceae bacterium]